MRLRREPKAAMNRRTPKEDTMKYGMNMLLWTTSVDESLYGTLDSLKKIGYDGVEIGRAHV